MVHGVVTSPRFHVEGLRSIAMSVSVCLSVCLSECLSVRSHASKTTHQTSPNSPYALSVAVARSSCDQHAIRYVLSVLWMSSRLPTIGQASVTQVGRILKVTHQGAEPGAKPYVYDCPVYASYL